MAARVSVARIGLLFRPINVRPFTTVGRHVCPSARNVVSGVSRSPWSGTTFAACISQCWPLGPRQQPSTLKASSCGLATSAAATVESSPVAPVLPQRLTKEEASNIPHKAQHHAIPRARAVKKRFKASIKKLNLVCKLVRRARVEAALMQLALSHKKVAKEVRDAIYAAKFNAANNHGMNPDNLVIDEIVIGRSSYLKRIEFKGRGRTGVRRLPYCRLAVYVREIQAADDFDKNHLRRRRPRWKCGSVRM